MSSLRALLRCLFINNVARFSSRNRTTISDLVDLSVQQLNRSIPLPLNHSHFFHVKSLALEYLNTFQSVDSASQPHNLDTRSRSPHSHHLHTVQCLSQWQIHLQHARKTRRIKTRRLKSPSPTGSWAVLLSPAAHPPPLVLGALSSPSL